MKKIFLLVFLISSIYPENRNHILYLMKKSFYHQAINYYNAHCSEGDFELLQKMGLIILQNGSKSKNIEERRLALFGAGLAASSLSLSILEKGINSNDMALELIAIHFISSLSDERTDELLIKAMNSNFLESRMEAAYQMARRKSGKAFGYAESLMTRLPPLFKPLFPEIFSLIGDVDSKRVLRGFLDDPNPHVRLNTILSIARHERRDLLPLLYKKLNHSTISEKEAIISSLGNMKDSASIDRIIKYSQSKNNNIKIASSLALLKLGNRSKLKNLFDLAMKKDLFAIAALSQVKESKKILLFLLNARERDVRINAAISLLKLRDPRSLKEIENLLLRDTLIMPIYSLGRSLGAFRCSGREKYTEISKSIKLSLLKDSLELRENDFLNFAKKILKKDRIDLISLTCSFLENIESERSINLLKEASKRAGHPLLRAYAHLSLYRMGIGKRNYIKNWIKENVLKKEIKLKSFQTDKLRYESSQYDIMPDTMAKLTIDMLSSVAEKRSLKEIEIILSAIKASHPMNKYILSGLLIRATE